MRIAFLQDIDPLVSGGGAQLTDKAMIMRGFARGHQIEIITPANPMFDGPLDLAIISNSTGFGAEIYEELKKKKTPYVFFVHDFGPQLCKWRLLYPMEERCRTLCYLRDRWRPILILAAGFIWLSPLHRRAWLFAYPELSKKPYVLVPSPVDPNMFYDLKEPRQGAIAVNEDVDFKGRDNLVLWASSHPDIPITLVGNNPEGTALPPNISLHPYVPYREMNALYNKHELFLHFPPNIQPFDRTVVEAYLAGCRLLVNFNVGATSWPFLRKGREAVRQALSASPERFWKGVEGFLK